MFYSVLFLFFWLFNLQILLFKNKKIVFFVFYSLNLYGRVKGKIGMWLMCFSVYIDVAKYLNKFL